jgi:predicted transcriptional regulator
VATYRTSVRIIADILVTARDYADGQEGVGITLILHRANLSYNRLVRILQDLVHSGLLEELQMERGNRYRISTRGLEFLSAYGRFEEFALSFGLRL